jgi:hypothetical protein
MSYVWWYLFSGSFVTLLKLAGRSLWWSTERRSLLFGSAFPP